jgi:hypothetical protein
MKPNRHKYKLLLFLSIAICFNSFAQTTTDAAIANMDEITNSTSGMVSAFKNSKKFVDFGTNLQKVVDLQSKVSKKYRNVRSVSKYANNREFANTYDMAIKTIEGHNQSANDYNSQIVSSLMICDQIINILNGKLSIAGVSSLVSSGVKLYEKISSGGLLGGDGASTPPPDPQKVVDNIKVNNDLLDNSYKEIDIAEEQLNSIDSYLDTFKIYDDNEKLLSESSSFAIY